MAIRAKWQNNAFALPLCERVPFHITQKPPAPELEVCPCVSPWCESEIEAGTEDLCSACETAAAWAFTPATTGQPEVLLHDEVTDSCLYLDDDEDWELDIDAGTLTLDETHVWTALQPWRCIQSNVVFNPDPPAGHNRHYCVEPIPVLFDPNTPCGNILQGVTSCPVLAARYAVTIDQPANGACVECSLPIYAGLGVGEMVVHLRASTVINQGHAGPPTLLGECGWSGQVNSSPSPLAVLCGARYFFIRLSLWVEIHPSSPPPFEYGKVYCALQMGQSFFGVTDAALYGGDFSCTDELTLTKFSDATSCIWQDELVFTPT